MREVTVTRAHVVLGHTMIIFLWEHAPVLPSSHSSSADGSTNHRYILRCSYYVYLSFLQLKLIHRNGFNVSWQYSFVIVKGYKDSYQILIKNRQTLTHLIFSNVNFYFSLWLQCQCWVTDGFNVVHLKVITGTNLFQSFNYITYVTLKG